MVNRYYLSGRPWLDNPDMVLKNPIFREKWLLQNDDVILYIKIGKVVLSIRINVGFFLLQSVSAIYLRK